MIEVIAHPAWTLQVGNREALNLRDLMGVDVRNNADVLWAPRRPGDERNTGDSPPRAVAIAAALRGQYRIGGKRPRDFGVAHDVERSPRHVIAAQTYVS